MNNRVEETRSREDAFDEWLAGQSDAVQLDYATTHEYGTVRDLLARLDAIKARIARKEADGEYGNECDCKEADEWIAALCDGSQDP